jgi:two-component system chemotaxis response regulator CheB
MPALAGELVRLTDALVSTATGAVLTEDADELDAVELDLGSTRAEEWAAVRSPFSCPDCHGVLFERKDGTFDRYRCRTGHAYSSEALASVQSHGVEEALWIAFRALEENAALLTRLAKRASERRSVRAAERFLAQARAIEARARVVRDALLRGGSAVA